MILGGLLIFYLQLFYWFWSDCVKLWHDLSLQFPCSGLSQHLCLSALDWLINGIVGTIIPVSHLWTYDWLLAPSEIGNALCCDCFVKHLHSIYYKGQIDLVPSSKNIWSQSSSETISFRHTVILRCYYRLFSTAAFSFRNGNVSSYFLQKSTVVIFRRCLDQSSLSFPSVISAVILIKLSYFIFCMSILITAPDDYLPFTVSVRLGSIADYHQIKICVKAYKHPAGAKNRCNFHLYALQTNI